MSDFLAWECWTGVIYFACVVGFFASALFVVRYHISSGGTWYRHTDGRPNQFGRFLVFRKTLLAVLFVIVVTNRVTPDWAAKEFVTAIVFLAFAFQTFVPYRLLLQAQKDIDTEEARQL